MTKKVQKKDQKQKELDMHKALEVLFASEYIDKHKLYLHNFIRGIVFGAGGVIGASLLIALLIWFLSIFDTIPLIGPFIDSTRNTIEQSQGSR